MTVSVALEYAAGRRRSPATMPGYPLRPAAAEQGDALRAKRPWSCGPALGGESGSGARSGFPAPLKREWRRSRAPPSVASG
jgi:hypothetical protein